MYYSDDNEEFKPDGTYKRRRIRYFNPFPIVQITAAYLAWLALADLPLYLIAIVFYIFLFLTW